MMYENIVTMIHKNPSTAITI